MADIHWLCYMPTTNIHQITENRDVGKEIQKKKITVITIYFLEIRHDFLGNIYFLKNVKYLE